MHEARKFPAYLAIVVAIATSGCREPELDRSSDIGQIDVLVGDLSDATRTSATFQALFAPNASPPDAERARYSKCTYRVTSEPVVEGDQANLRVAVRDSNDAEIAVMDWKATKSGNAWRLSAAPLPQ